MPLLSGNLTMDGLFKGTIFTPLHKPFFVFLHLFKHDVKSPDNGTGKHQLLRPVNVSKRVCSSLIQTVSFINTIGLIGSIGMVILDGPGNKAISKQS